MAPTDRQVRGGLQDVDMWLVDQLAVPASLHDVDGRFVHLNTAAERASGKSKAYWLGRLLTDRLPHGVREQVSAHFRRVVELGVPTEFETVFYDGSGHLRGVRAQQMPLVSGEDVVGVLILAFDVHGVPSRPTAVGPEARLTPRQREVLELIAAGLSTSDIAQSLTLSRETVRNHVRSVLRELRVHSRLEAIVAARRSGLLASPALQPPQPPDGASPLH